jgi:hypothetical protein
VNIEHRQVATTTRHTHVMKRATQVAIRARGRNATLRFRREFTTGGIESIRARSLNEVVKLEAFAQLSGPEIDSLWQAYHSEQPFALGRTFEAPSVLVSRASECPQYIIPVIKEQQGFYFMFAEFKPDEATAYMTPLEDYRKSPRYAQPWLALQFFTDVPGTVLGQANFLKALAKPQAEALVDAYVEHYSKDALYNKHVAAFNKRQGEFDFADAFPRVKPFLRQA